MAKDTIKEALRNKIIVAIFLVFLVILFIYKITGIITVGVQERILTDLSSLTITLFVLVISSILSVHLFRQELERGTLYFTLTYPVTKAQFIFGKIVGISIISLMMIIFLYFELFVILYFSGGHNLLNLFYYIIVLWLKSILIITLSLVFAIGASRVMSLSIISFIILTSHIKLTIVESIKEVIPSLYGIINLVYGYILPDFSSFSIDGGYKIDSGFFTHFLPIIFIYTFSLSYIYYVLSVFLFKRKDL